ncbi:MAG: Tfp pilus assembly protein FimT/FimU [Candidatus Babeliales bacterium]
MKHSKSHKAGVTFIEIMLTIFMMGMILSSAFVSQSTILEQLGRWSRSLRSTLALRELFIHVAQDRMLGKTHPPEQKKGSLILTYESFRPKKESSLSKIEDLHIERAKAVWGQDQETMISFLYKHEKPEDREKK